MRAGLMRVLVYIGEQDGLLDPDALGLLSRAAGLDAQVSALLCGHGVTRLADAVARAGARRIIVADHPVFAEPLYAPRVDLLAQVCASNNFDLLLFSTTVLTSELAAALAARLEAGVIWGLVDLVMQDGRLVGKRLAQNDSVLAACGWTTAIGIGLFRPGAVEPVASEDAGAKLDIVEADLQDEARYPRFVARTAVTGSEGPSLRNAEVVVSGGRGIETRNNLELIRELAAVLGGVAGVSLPLVEMGWAPRAMQVGQTGTLVKPRLYVACGISGQIQHRIGMDQSGTIVAINKDPEAPIMYFCDLAVVAEVQAVVPRLIDLLRQRQLPATET